MHTDGAWGGSFVFSDTYRQRTLKGCELADSIAINPYIITGVPVTCSSLLLKDLKNAHMANTLRAGYLFHNKPEDDDDEQLTQFTNDAARDHTDLTPDRDD